MNENEKPDAGTNSTNGEQGVEEGLNPESDRRDYSPSGRLTHRDYTDPLFLKENPEGQKGNLQDEKDESAE